MITKQQLAVIKAPTNKNICVVAAAGSGKTFTISKRVVHLLETNIDPKKIVVLSFTRKAANEIRTRINNKEVVCSTFHQFCLTIIRSMTSVFGPHRTVIDEQDKEQLMSQYVDKSIVQKLNRMHSYARNTMTLVDEDDPDFLDVELTTVFSQYEEQKDDQRMLDFDDILCKFNEKLTPKLSTFLANHFRYIHVDEFQDTNNLQTSILKKLVDGGSFLFAVGDSRQEIYGFRGSDYRNILEFTNIYPNSVSLELTLNFRSVQPILDLSNQLLCRSPIDYGSSIKSSSGDGEIPLLVEFYDHKDVYREEARWVVKQIRSNYSDYMIIVRTSFEARAFENELLRCKIPYTFIGGKSVLNAAHIKDVVSVLRSAIKCDRLSMTRYLCMWPGIGPAKAASMIEQGLGKYQGLLDAVKSATTVTDAIDIAVSGISHLFDARYKGSADKRMYDIRQLSYIGASHKTLQSFIDTYNLDPVDDEQDDKKVLLITSHSSKGMERKNVFISKVQWGHFPHPRSTTEEERRLLYVAMTRAKDRLIMTTINGRDSNFDFLDDLTTYKRIRGV